MTTYDFNDQITFVLPDDFTYSVEEDDDGDESTRIKGGRFVDYFGDIQYRQECRVHYQELEYGEARDGLTSDTFLQSVVSRVPGEDADEIPGNPPTFVKYMDMPMSMFGMDMRILTLTIAIQVSDWSWLSLISVLNLTAGDESEEELLVSAYEFFDELLSSIRLHGQKLSTADGVLAECREILGLSPSVEDDIDLWDEDETIETFLAKMAALVESGERLCEKMEEMHEQTNYVHTDGDRHDLKALFRKELGLLIIRMRAPSKAFNEVELALLRDVLEKDVGPEWLEEWVAQADEIGYNFMFTLWNSALYDKHMLEQYGDESIEMSNSLIGVYEDICEGLLQFNDNPKVRYNKTVFVEGMRSYVDKNIYPPSDFEDDEGDYEDDDYDDVDDDDDDNLTTPEMTSDDVSDITLDESEALAELMSLIKSGEDLCDTLNDAQAKFNFLTEVSDDFDIKSALKIDLTILIIGLREQSKNFNAVERELLNYLLDAEIDPEQLEYIGEEGRKSENAGKLALTSAALLDRTIYEMKGELPYSSTDLLIAIYGEIFEKLLQLRDDDPMVQFNRAVYMLDFEKWKHKIVYQTSDFDDD